MIDWGYNTKGEVVNTDHNNNAYDKSQNFDGIGNRITATDATGVTNYISDDHNAYTSVGGNAQVFDNDGNPLNMRLPVDSSADSILEWNGKKRLTKVTKPDGTVITIEYDHAGRRFRKNVSSVGSTYWVYDGHNAIAKYIKADGASEPTLDRTYYWGIPISELAVHGHTHGHSHGEPVNSGIGGLLSVNDSQNSFFPLMDGNGSITEYLNLDGTLAATYKYDSFGNTLASGGVKVDDFVYGFGSRPVDKDLGLIYYNYRYYHPIHGRWINEDPIEEEGGLNHYAFVKNDPVNHWDELGLWGTSGHDIILDKLLEDYKDFKFLSKHQVDVIAIMKEASEKVDGVGDGQGMGDFIHAQLGFTAYQHAMKAPGEPENLAALKMSNWVNMKQIDAMRKLKRAIDTCDVELYKKAVGLYGESMHALMDETSPSHVGTQTWYGTESKLVLSPAIYALYVKKHKDAETDDVLRPMLNGIVINLVISQVKMLVHFFELAQQPIETL